MEHVDLTRWVADEQDPARRAFKQAVHTVLLAIASTPRIGASMIIKGGILLAIRYNNSRYTRDIDFSTSGKYQTFDQANFVEQLNAGLANASEALDYGLACHIQSVEVKPKRPDATFPTLKIRAGYAYKHDEPARRKLATNNASTVVEIDYSFNEVTQDTEVLHLTDNATLSAYSYEDLVAEKFRAMLQQVTRNRARRQDVFDLYQLLTGDRNPDDGEKIRIHKALQASAASKGIVVRKDMLRQPEIKSRSLREYHLLQDEIEGELPNFELAFSAVCEFYESLPWLKE